MNDTTATTEVRARLQELVPDFWTAVEVRNALNEGLRRFSAQEKWEWLFTEVTNVAYVADTATVDLVEGVSVNRHFNLAFVFSGDIRPYPAHRVSAAQGFRLRERYTGSQSHPGAFYVTKSTDADDDSHMVTTVRFVPPVNRAATIVYQYIRDPDALTTGTDQLDIPEEYAMGVVAYATGLLWLKELRDSRKADEQFALFWQVVDDAKREQRKLHADENVAWGRNQPQLGYASETDEAYRLIGGRTLGP